MAKRGGKIRIELTLTNACVYKFFPFWQHGLQVAQCVDLTLSTLKVFLSWTTANRPFRRPSTTAHGPSATWAKRFYIQQAPKVQTACTRAPVRMAQVRCRACQ